MSNYNEMDQEENDPNVVAQKYREDMNMAEQQSAADGTVNMSGSTQQQGTATATVQVTRKRPDGWKTEDGKMWRWDNYYTLPDEYKKFLEPKNTKGKLDPTGPEPPIHADPFDGKTYKFWVAFFDNGGSRVSCMEWNTNQQSGGVGGSGGFKKSFYKTIDLEEGNIDQIKAFYASVRDNKKIMFKLADSIPITVTEIRTDGTKVIKQELRHVLELQERIEYG